MNKNLRAVLFVIFMVSVSLISHFPQNMIGSFLGYGDCPNCHDNWWWKEWNVVNYESSENFGKIGGGGVIICKECLKHPERLGPEKIKKSLLKYNRWKEKDADLAAKAVARYKSDHTKVRI